MMGVDETRRLVNETQAMPWVKIITSGSVAPERGSIGWAWYSL